MAPLRTCVLLVGMHRSGTSALARVLNIAGVALPAHVLAANPTNPAGHWEPERLVDLHEQMFAELRTSWSDWRRLDVGDLPPARLAHYKAKIAQLITEEYADAPVFVLKDPRVCRMVPLYREIFRDLGIELRPVLIFRHPLEVAASLARRDGLSVFAAQLCWLRNVLDAEADTRDMRRAVVPYEQLIGDWRAQTAFLAARLGIELPLDGDEQQRQVDAFLRADLRHHDFTRTELDRNPEISDWVREAYAAICVAETDPGRARAMLDEVRAAFDAAVRMVSEKPAELIVQEMSGREQLKARLRQQAERHAREMREAEERLELAQAQIRAAQAETEAVRAAFTGSTSWRVTAPLRKSVSSVRRLPRSGPQLRQVCRSAAYFLWRRLPLGNAARDTTKTVLFSALPFVFRDTAVYRRWQDSRRVRPRNDIWGALGAQEADARYVPHRPDLPPAATPVKLVAFYLPQFHPIPENDRWWGEGFTEWTNVRPAQPLFEGHYQPHVPDELGYYDLRDRDVQRRQIELARQYGIGGFCFYAYWFSGKRLLEKPLDAWLADPGLDFPFCVCWANENWTRRWDGLDREILMRQHHSPDNDIAFISDMAKYLADPRYIRVKDRPLLVVYRPGDLRTRPRPRGAGASGAATTASAKSISPTFRPSRSAIRRNTASTRRSSSRRSTPLPPTSPRASGPRGRVRISRSTTGSASPSAANTTKSVNIRCIAVSARDGTTPPGARRTPRYSSTILPGATAAGWRTPSAIHTATSPIPMSGWSSSMPGTSGPRAPTWSRTGATALPTLPRPERPWKRRAHPGAVPLWCRTMPIPTARRCWRWPS